MSKTFIVEFFEDRNGVSSRRRLQNNTTFLAGATSEFAIQSWLKRQFPNSEINIQSIEWR